MNLRVFLPVVLCLGMAGNIFAQFGSHHYYRSYGSMSNAEKKNYQRTYGGLSMPVMNMNISSIYQDVSTGKFTYGLMNSIIKKFGMKGAIGVYGGSCFKLGKTSESSMIALDIAFTADLFNYNIGLVDISNNNKITFSKTSSLTENLSTLIMRMPISVMYKTGNEVTLTMSNDALFSIGAGLAPSIAFNAYENVNNTFFKLQPVVISEIGIWFIKLRASYYFGNCTYMSASGDEMSNYSGKGNFLLTAKSSGNFVGSLVFLLAAGKWER
jgi:hypothetical protein